MLRIQAIGRTMNVTVRIRPTNLRTANAPDCQTNSDKSVLDRARRERQPERCRVVEKKRKPEIKCTQEEIKVCDGKLSGGTEQHQGWEAMPTVCMVRLNVDSAWVRA